MNRSVRAFPAAVLALAATAACGARAPSVLPAPPPNETRLVIFHSNDVHGKIDRFAKVAAILKKERDGGAEVFYLCAGDNFTGNPIVDRFDPRGEPVLEIYNRLGLDALCPGNHDFDYGLDVLERFAARARFPVVSANIRDPMNLFPQLRPSVVLTGRTGVKIALFGLIQIEAGSGLPSTLPERVRGLRFDEPFRKALEMKGLRREGQVFIGLTHLGLSQDRKLAELMPELDVIVGGHSHTRVDPAETVNGVLIAQTGSDNRYLGRVDLLLRDGRVVEKKGRLIDLDREKREDPEVRKMIEAFNRDPSLTRVLASAPFDITGKDALGSLMTDAWRRELKLDIAFQNNGGIRLYRLDRKITIKDVYALDPFENQVVVIEMTADEIRGLIRESFERGSTLDLQVSGIVYTVVIDDEKRVLEVRLSCPDGTPLPEDRTYRVGLSSYIPSAYDFEHKDPGKAIGITTADAMIRFLEKRPDLSLYRNIHRAFKEPRGVR